MYAGDKTFEPGIISLSGVIIAEIRLSSKLCFSGCLKIFFKVFSFFFVF